MQSNSEKLSPADERFNILRALADLKGFWNYDLMPSLYSYDDSAFRLKVSKTHYAWLEQELNPNRQLIWIVRDLDYISNSEEFRGNTKEFFDIYFDILPEETQRIILFNLDLFARLA